MDVEPAGLLSGARRGQPGGTFQDDVYCPTQFHCRKKGNCDKYTATTLAICDIMMPLISAFVKRDGDCR